MLGEGGEEGGVRALDLDPLLADDHAADEQADGGAAERWVGAAQACSDGAREAIDVAADEEVVRKIAAAAVVGD